MNSEILEAVKGGDEKRGTVKNRYIENTSD